MNYRFWTAFVVTFMGQFSPLRLIEYLFISPISLDMHILRFAFFNKRTRHINLFFRPYQVCLL
jgi:hypothetical protein